MPFVKLDIGILDSTLWVSDADVRIVFLTMLCMAQPDGLVEATAPGIARRANLSLERTRKAIGELKAPDPDSRTMANEGRRIRRIDGGYEIMNYAKYREKDHTAAERKRRQRARQKEDESHRDRCDAEQPVTVVTPPVTYAEAETEVEADSDAHAHAHAGHTTAAPQPLPDPADEILAEIKPIYPKRSGDQPWTRARKAIHARLGEGHTAEELVAGVGRYAAWCRATGKVGAETVKMAATFFGPDKPFLEPWTPPQGGNASGTRLGMAAPAPSESLAQTPDDIEEQERVMGQW